MPRLYHVSDKPGITLFTPRHSPLFGPAFGNVVWAVSESHLVNYLLPRACPRVTFAASDQTSDADRKRFDLGTQDRVVVVERGWWERVRQSTIHLYELPADTFTHHDEHAGYWISPDPVRPMSVTAVSNLPAAIAAREAELRVVDNLWPIHDEVTASTLSFSIIRMRNATVPTEAAARHYLEMVQSRENEDAFHGLIELGAPVIPVLAKRFERETSPAIRSFLTKVAWHVRSDDVLQILSAALSAPEAEVWKEALDGLVSIATPQSLAVVRDALGDSVTPKKEWLMEARRQIEDQLRASGSH